MRRSRCQHPSAAPEGFLEPRGGLRCDQRARRQRQHRDRQRIGELRRPRDLHVGPGPERYRRPRAAREGHERRQLGQGRGRHAGAHLQAIARAERQATARGHCEAPVGQFPGQRRVGRARCRGLHQLAGPQQEEVLLDVGRLDARRHGQAPGQCHRDRRQLRLHLGDDEQGTDGELRVRARRQEDLRVPRGRSGCEQEGREKDSTPGSSHAAAVAQGATPREAE
jgi:hypothetical protein